MKIRTTKIRTPITAYISITVSAIFIVDFLWDTKTIVLFFLLFSKDLKMIKESPNSLSFVSYPLRSDSIKSWIDAFFAASTTSVLSASSFAIFMLCSIVSWNKKVSCVT